MKRWSKLVLTAALFTALTTTLVACKNFAFPGVEKIEIEQGNIVTQEMVDQLQPGMTREQVRFILGTPLVVDTFNNNRWDYVYRLDDRHNPVESKQISVFFDNDSLVRFTGDFAPTIKTIDGESPLTEQKQEE